MPEGAVVLVAADPALAATVRGVVESVGGRVVELPTVAAAVERIEHGDPVVVAIDGSRVGGGVDAVVDTVRSTDSGRPVPILVLGAHVEPAPDRGIVDSLALPVVTDDLLARLAAYELLWRQRREITRLRVAGEARYRNLADLVPAIVFSLGPDGDVRYVNERWAAYAGGRSFPSFASGRDESWGVVDVRDHAGAMRHWLGLRADPARYAVDGALVDMRLRRADGRMRWHRIRMLPQHDDGTGDVDGWVGTAVDVETEHRAEVHQRVLADSGSVLGSSTDWRGELDMLATTLVPLVADWCSIVVLGADGTPDVVACRHDRMLDGAVADQLAIELDPQDSSTLPGRVLGRGGRRERGTILAEDANGMAVDGGADGATRIAVPMIVRGELVGVVVFALALGDRTFTATDQGFVRELSRRCGNVVDSASLLLDAEQRARAAEVLATIADGIFLVDNEGVIALWNRSAEAITGLSATDVVGARASEVIPGWKELRDAIPVHVAGEEGAVSFAESLPFDIGGHDRWLSIAGVHFDLGVAYAFRDITEERTVERLKSDFVATVSHELRTPLASIYGAAATLQRTDIDVDSGMRDQLLAVISDQSEQLARIVNDVLTASRIDTGATRSEHGVVDVDEIALEVVEAARIRSTDAHEFLLRTDGTDGASGGSHEAIGDSGHLRQVLGNLVDNAVKYSPGGGAVEVVVETADDAVRVTVTDHGLGVAPADQRRIFEKFYRVDASMTRGIGGTGLGLYICRELVRQMNGRIWMSSVPGEGATFSVELQRAPDRDVDHTV